MLVVVTAIAVDLVDAAGLRGLQADARRRRHLVPRRRRPAAGSGWTSSGTTCRSPRSRPICSTRSSPSRITGSSAIPASIRSRSAAPSSATCAAPGTRRGRQHAHAAARAHAVPVEPEDATAARRREAVLALLIDAQLTKEQILELYLNRIYLSAGVYGVETMSRHLFGKPAKHADACRERADRRAGPRAVGAVAVVEPRRRASRAATSCCARMREEGFITEAQEQRGAGSARSAIRPYPGATDPRGGYAKEYLRQQFRDSSAATTRPTGTCGRRSCRSCRRRPSARSRTGSRRFGDAELQAALVAIDPRDRRRAGAGRRARLPRSRSSTAPAAAGGSRARRSSRSCSPPRSSAATRRCRVLDGLDDDRAAGARRVGAAQRRRRRRRTR